ncbi:glycoside hydrolase superfamily [Gymnopilus junonius]|uniref:mannan endo-1,4-beta-mannosidase n=1 Tax=Gymnopilus junonius TaxID=109634 RepID=A0A9P5NE90_GYMJU|nr:glycoside hydrolase superfamily [Gymnopilus junonius]
MRSVGGQISSLNFNHRPLHFNSTSAASNASPSTQQAFVFTSSQMANSVGRYNDVGDASKLEFNWISEISAYIKSIDSNHLVAVGDEGFFNEPTAATYPYQGSEGVDFVANLAVSPLTSSYPDSLGLTGQEGSWGSQWIIDHQTAQANAKKPVIMEEFGVTSNQSAVYTAWWNTVISSGLTGNLIWQAGSHLSSGDTPNDGYAIYPDGPVYPILTSHAAALKARG